MKKSFFTIAALLLFSIAYSQDNAIDRFFSKYEDNADFTVVNVSPRVFPMLAKVTSELEDKEYKTLIEGLKGLKMVTTSKDPNKYYQEVISRLPKKEYEELVTVKDKGQNIKFLTKGTNDKISELLLLIGGGTDFMLLSIVGDIDLNKVAKLANKMNIQGSEHFDKVKKKN
ncbi:MAG TPA: DUF4252 domain-containing protein [Saprospiraceae bacterium]|nr:DUF4252 domain-containing protein [Saprospiraceae bacterium]